MPTVIIVYHRFQDIHVLNYPVGTTLRKMSLNRDQVHGVEHSQLVKQVSLNAIIVHFVVALTSRYSKFQIGRRNVT